MKPYRNRSARRSFASLGILVMLLFGLLLLGLTDDESGKTVRVERLVIVDANGRAVVELRGGEHGGEIVLRSTEGKDVMRIQAESRGGAVRAYQADERPAVEIHTFQMTATKTAGAITTFDVNGRAATTLGTGDGGGGPVSMGAGCPGGVLAIVQDEKLRRLDSCLLERLFELVDEAEQ